MWCVHVLATQLLSRCSYLALSSCRRSLSRMGAAIRGRTQVSQTSWVRESRSLQNAQQTGMSTAPIPIVGTERSGNILGEIVAEADSEMLQAAFYESRNYRELVHGTDFRFVVGRRGTGKSALYT